MPYQFDEHQHTEALIDFSRGHYKNATPVNLFGFNRTVATSFETLANDGGGLYTFPASALTLSVVSSEADTCTVTIVGLDTNWAQISETVTLTGTTPVSTTKQFLRINLSYVATGTQSGNVTISNGGTTYCYIEAGTGISEYGIYSTAANEKLYISGVSFTSGSVNSNKYITGRVYKKTNGGAIQRFWQATWAIGQLNYSVPVPFQIPPMTDFAFECKSSSGENEIAVFVNAFSIIDE